MAFVKLDRKIFNNPLWNENRTYSRFEAWLDLIASAKIENWKTHIKGKDIEVLRGEILASNRFLQTRWNWSNSKVSNFLKYLKKEKMITTRNDAGNTVITLVKYEDYNGRSDTKKDTEATPKRQSKELKERKEIFLTKVKEYNPQHDLDELLKFFEYWSEHKSKGRKMLFEMQKTWNLEMRIKKWFSNKSKWEKEKKVSAPKKEKVTAAQALENMVNEVSSN